MCELVSHLRNALLVASHNSTMCDYDCCASFIIRKLLWFEKKAKYRAIRLTLSYEHIIHITHKRYAVSPLVVLVLQITQLYAHMH